MCSVVTIAFVMPISQDVNATSSFKVSQYQAFPSPTVKPKICTNIADSSDKNYINKKQAAAAAAMGLYLGIKQAIAPQVTVEKDLNTCA